MLKFQLQVRHLTLHFYLFNGSLPCRLMLKNRYKLNPVQLLWPSLLLGSVAVGFCFWATSNYGPGLTPDSASYLSTAESLSQGAGWKVYGGRHYLNWPPLYPFLIMTLSAVGLGLKQAALVLNGLAFGLTVVVTGLLLQRFIRSLLLFSLVLLILAFSPILLRIHTIVWSEGVYIFLSILSLYFLMRYLESRSELHYILLILFSALCVLQRFVGVVNIAVLALGLLLFSKWKRGLTLAMIYGISSCLPVGLWMVRNYTISQTLTGYRSPSTLGFIKATERLYSVANNYFSLSLPLWMWLSLTLLVILIFIGFLNQTRVNSLEPAYWLVTVTVVFCIAYTSFLLITSALSS